MFCSKDACVKTIPFISLLGLLLFFAFANYCLSVVQILVTEVSILTSAHRDPGPGVPIMRGELHFAPVRLEDLPLEDVERILIRKALSKHAGNVSRAARALGLSRSALYRRLDHFRIAPQDAT